ncbi:carbonic anhydrase 6-like [Engraulis encrasicolus]|uniref:carbonic anhydrase 6-like n=1 Tax=Engraulis encrasicolus TaxID=184585 RepID=UPI002FD4D05A
MSKIINTGKTVKVMFKPKSLGLSGGSLSADYLPLQFHLHWGNLSSVPGSEHAVDGQRYPMEMHILSVKSIYSSNFSQATKDSEGLAVLGFFIEVDDDTVDQPESWRKLTSYLSKITEKGQSVRNISGISLDDLIGGVDTTSYYRYLGSVTVPACHEIVVWTVFKEPIKVSKNLIDQFSTTVRVGNNCSEFITNNYRTLQPLNGR